MFKDSNSIESYNEKQQTATIIRFFSPENQFQLFWLVLCGIYLYIYKHACIVSFTLQLSFSKFSKPQKHLKNGTFHWDSPVVNILQQLFMPLSFDLSSWLYVAHIMTLYNQILKQIYSKKRVCLFQMSSSFWQYYLRSSQAPLTHPQLRNQTDDLVEHIHWSLENF